MSYRKLPTTTPVMCDVATASTLHLLNGVIAEFAVPCSYIVPIEGTKQTELVPIRLREEGYGEPSIGFDHSIEGLNWSAWIDELDDSIIRFAISAQCPDAIHEDFTCNISVLITRGTDGKGDRTDAVLRGQLLIKASPLPGVTPDIPEQLSTSANKVSVSVAEFATLLSIEDITVQKALETLDSHAHQLEGTLFEHTHDFDLTPTGAVSSYAGDAAPDGWFLCQGQAVSRAVESSLFAVIGTKYGAGDGSTTFNLPNLKGRVPVGLDTSQTDFDVLGETGGSKSHTLTPSQMPSHTHTQDSHNHTQGSHNHTQSSHTHTQSSHNHTQNAHNHSVTVSNKTLTGYIHNMASQTSGTAITAGGIFSAKTYGEGGGYGTFKAGTWGDSVDLNATHNHSASSGNTTATNSATTATNNSTTATNNSTTATNNATTATNQSTGGGGAHNNLQPYITLNYIIKR